MMLSDRMRDLAGFAFFTFAAAVSTISAWGHPSILAWLYAAHNGLLALLYSRRRPAKRYDRTGLWLGMIAAFLPGLTVTGKIPLSLLLPGLAGYALILWSLTSLGTRFGIAPADRGLTCRGPYRYLRHPIYLGELIFRVVMLLASPHIRLAIWMVLALVSLQCWRIVREEKLIEGYSAYARIVPWRLLPGIW